MMSCPDLNMPASGLSNVRLRDFIQKRGSGVLKNWNDRYVVISSNFLYFYMHDKVRGLWWVGAG